MKNLRGAKPEKLRQLADQIAAAETLVAARQAAVPRSPTPTCRSASGAKKSARRSAAHQVVVVAGETGSGKTTQLPKICLDVGRGVRGMIGHTQPRRLAARTVAQRIADELGSPLGEAVGYTVRFNDRVSDRTLVKLMTDGILLAEIQRDRRLLRYDTLILDEAHERSLNIDFLLGYLHELLPRRPDLKVIVTSATIEPQRFAAHFGGAPIIEVSGRTYPVEISYRPLEVAGFVCRTETIPTTPTTKSSAPRPATRSRRSSTPFDELEAEPPGDVLVFLSGEREIRDTAEALERRPTTAPKCFRSTPGCRLPSSRRSLHPHTGRRVVLATNVAETSLTVPGIRYVVDPGNARISRYSRRVEGATVADRTDLAGLGRAASRPVRTGRAGRLHPPVLRRGFRRPPALHRTGDSADEPGRGAPADGGAASSAMSRSFPFLDPPDRRSIRDGVQLLQELGAFDQHGAITDVGRRLARLPVDPRLGRMILQAETEGCVREMLVLAAALTIPDPRERPADREEAARQSTPDSPTSTPTSCPTSTSGVIYASNEKNCPAMLFDEYAVTSSCTTCASANGRTWSGSCAASRATSASSSPTSRPTPAAVHAALLAGLLSHVGMRREDAREYLGARNARFVLAPGSALTKRPPRWVVVAELVETSRLYGRTAARIQPEIVERVAGDLVQRTYSEPHWDAKRGEVMAYERVTLYGLPLVARRRVGYAAVEPAVARELFIRHALVEGDWQTRHHFFRDNARLRDRARGAGGAGPSPRPARRRRRDLRVLRRPHPGRSGLRAALRRVVEEAAAQDTGPADLHPRRPAAHRRRRRRRADRTPGRRAMPHCR